MRIQRLPLRIRSLSFEVPHCYRCIPKHRHLHIGIIDAVILRRFRVRQRLALARHFPIAPRIYELIRQQRRDHVRIIRLLRLKPFLFQCGDSVLGPPSCVLVLRPPSARQ